jgi:hypothetical protein
MTRESGRFLIRAFGAAVFCLSLTAVAGSGTPLLVLSSDTDTATAGYYRLEWSWTRATAESGGEFELQESTHPDFSDAAALYRGPDLATVISGRGDGRRYYRVRAKPDAAWSNSVQVTTAHHPLSRALAFFAAGALVFALTLAMILHGSQQR